MKKIVKSTPFIWNHMGIYEKYMFNRKKFGEEIKKNKITQGELKSQKTIRKV